MKAQFIIEDDQGVMDTVDVKDYENITEAHVGIIEVLIEWFENTNVYVEEECFSAIGQLHNWVDDIKNGAIDEDDVLDISGFTISIKGVE